MQTTIRSGTGSVHSHSTNSSSSDLAPRTKYGSGDYDHLLYDEVKHTILNLCIVAINVLARTNRVGLGLYYTIALDNKKCSTQENKHSYNVVINLLYCCHWILIILITPLG